MGGSQLNAVVAAESKGISKTACRFHERLADLHDGEGRSAGDQVLPGQLEIVAADLVFPLAAGQAGHCFSPADPRDGDGFGAGTDLLHLFRLGLNDEQLDQGAGIAEQDHRVNRDPRSRCR